MFDIESADVNPQCLEIKETESYKKLIKNADDQDLHKSTYNDRYLSQKQLSLRVSNYREKYQMSRLATLNSVKKYNSLKNTLSLHQRLLILLKDNDIPRLRSLLEVAMKNKRSVRYILQKIIDVVDGIYMARPKESDKDLALLIQQMGGPALLDIVHRAIGLPSNSTAYRLLRQTCYMKSTLSATPSDVLQNVEFDLVAQPPFSRMLKIDETFVNNRIGWDPRSNEIVGFCYEHAEAKETFFESEEVIDKLCDKLERGEIHQCKEVTAFAIAANAEVPNSQFALLWASCTKTATVKFHDLVANISDEMVRKHGKPFLCWATDGDGGRRLIFATQLMTYELSESHIPELYEVIKDLDLFDLTVGKHGESLDCDPKHLAKRLRNAMLSGSWNVDGRTITKNDVMNILGNQDVSTHTIKKLVDVFDKQNVPLATDLLLAFSEGVKKIDSNPSISFRVMGVKKVLSAFTVIIDGLLSFYCKTSLSLKEQLTNISAAMHVLLSLQRCCSIVPNVLFHDLMVTFENAFLATAKMQLEDPNIPMYLFLCGTDPLERLFGNVKIKLGHNTVSNLGLINTARSTNACTKVRNIIID